MRRSTDEALAGESRERGRLVLPIGDDINGSGVSLRVLVADGDSRRVALLSGPVLRTTLEPRGHKRNCNDAGPYPL